MFSFNNPFGACQTCSGLGMLLKVDLDLVVPDPSLSIRQGAIKASGWSYALGGTIAQMYYEALAKHYNFSLDVPYAELPEQAKQVIMFGTNGEKIKMQRVSEYGSGTYNTDFEGVVNNLERRYKETSSDYMRSEIELFM
jgi:excinuclease ABC subunit A